MPTEGKTNQVKQQPRLVCIQFSNTLCFVLIVSKRANPFNSCMENLGTTLDLSSRS